MKKKTFAIAGLAATMILSACSSSVSNEKDTNNLIEALENISKTEMETIEVSGKYSMDIPDFMKSTTSLNDDASLQYNNLYKEKYIIVIDEDKDEFVDAFKAIDEYDESMSVVDNYASVQLQFMAEAGTINKESSLKKTKINGMEARIKAIDADIPGVPEPISYWLGYVEGENTMYTVMAWTLESRKSDFEKEANDMIESLKELK